MEPIALVVEEKSATVSPSNEIEMVIQTKIICLDSYNNILEKRVKIDVEMSVRDQILYQVRKKFATYLTYDFDDRKYEKFEYSRVELNYIGNLHPSFNIRTLLKASDKTRTRNWIKE